MPKIVRDTAGVIAWAIAAILVISTLSLIVSQSVCVFGFSKEPSFCTTEAITGRRSFFLEVVAGLGAMWAAMKLVERA